MRIFLIIALFATFAAVLNARSIPGNEIWFYFNLS